MASLRHVGIVVTDMDKSLKLYRDIFNLEVIWDRVESGQFIDNLLQMFDTKVHTVKLRDCNGGVIELLQYLSHPRDINYNDDVARIGCSHIAITVDNVDDMYEKLTSEGLEFNYKPQVSVDGNAHVTFCRDYDQVLIEIVEEVK